MPYPLIGFGYEEVGEVVEVAPEVVDRHPGQLVWGIWGHRAEAVLAAEAVWPLPADLDPLAAVFARPGAIALTAVLAGDLHLGDWVGVFGQGVIGLLATRLAALSGARVVAVDRVPARLAHATRYGARSTVDVAAQSAAAVLRDLTGGRGADVCLELSGAYPALHEAIRSTAHAGRVVAAGFYQGQADALGLGEEFHHNRIQLVAAQVSGPTPRRAWPAGGPEIGSRRPSWTWWLSTASTRCRWSATSSTPARSPTPSRCSTAAPVTSSKWC